MWSTNQVTAAANGMYVRAWPSCRTTAEIKARRFTDSSANKRPKDVLGRCIGPSDYSVQLAEAPLEKRMFLGVGGAGHGRRVRRGGLLVFTQTSEHIGAD